MDRTIKFPNVVVTLPANGDESAGALLAQIENAMTRAACPPEDMETFANLASGHGYQHVLDTAKRWITIEETRA